MFKKILSQILIAALVLPIVVSCKDNGNDPQLTRELKRLSRDESLSAEGREEAGIILSQMEEIQTVLTKNPGLKALPGNSARVSPERAAKIHHENAEKTFALLDEQNQLIHAMAENVKRISKIKYDHQMDVAKIAESETLLLMNLLVLRHITQSASRRILMLMTKFDKPYFDDLSENSATKQRLLSDYSTALAISSITANDLRVTLKQLVELKKDALLSDTLKLTIDRVVGGCAGHERLDRGQVDKFAKESLTSTAQESLQKTMASYHDLMKAKSLLFDPANPDHPIVHVLVIVSNLSWGLINTMVGLGFVITAAIVAPVTQVAGAGVRAMGSEPLFMEMRMPKLRIADSGMQIYADVCGLGFIPSKMSAGLFELDFCTGYTFASDHEAGHAKQSALLGPLYFPAAILSYILNMGHGGFIEDWADAWATT